MSKFKVGTLEHCYEELEGDVRNCSNGYSSGNIYVLVSSGKYYTSAGESTNIYWETVCTIEEFNEYAKQMKQKENNMSKEQPKNVWTEEDELKGISFKVGDTCYCNEVGELVEVKYRGDNFVVYSDSRGMEGCCTEGFFRPIKTLSAKEKQVAELEVFIASALSDFTVIESLYVKSLARSLQESKFIVKV